MKENNAVNNNSESDARINQSDAAAYVTAPHPSGRKHIFLTGRKQVGKSTLLKQLLPFCEEELGEKVTGFATRPYRIEGERKGFYMHSLGSVPGYANDVPVTMKLYEKKGMTGITDSFEKFGAAVLANSLVNDDVILMDELGRAEKNAEEFKAAVWKCLDEGKFVFGVLQQAEAEFLAAVSAREDVTVYVIDEGNRDRILPELKEDMRRQLKRWHDFMEPAEA